MRILVWYLYEVVSWHLFCMRSVQVNKYILTCLCHVTFMQTPKAWQSIVPPKPKVEFEFIKENSYHRKKENTAFLFT